MVYNDEQLGYVKESYISSKGLAAIAREQLKGKIDPPPSVSDIRRIWELLGYTNKNTSRNSFHRAPLNIKELDLIIERIPMYGSLTSAARALGRDPSTAINKLRGFGLLQIVRDLEARTKK